MSEDFRRKKFKKNCVKISDLFLARIGQNRQRQKKMRRGKLVGYKKKKLKKKVIN